MRKVLLSAALAASTLAVAAPAAAQWAPAPQAYGYNSGYGYNSYGQVRDLQARIDRIQYQIRDLDRRNILSPREARGLMGESFMLENRLRNSSRFGLNFGEVRDIQFRTARLEQRVRHEMFDRDRRFGNGYGYNNGYNAYGYPDRDRDHRDDRYEDDHGWDHDRR